MCYDSGMQLSSLTPISSRFKSLDPRSERNLAVAILRQAWLEAVLDLRVVRETSREDHRHLKEKAIEWIASDEDGFPYWCKLADLDCQVIRQKLCGALKHQRRTGKA